MDFSGVRILRKFVGYVTPNLDFKVNCLKNRATYMYNARLIMKLNMIYRIPLTLSDP